MMDWQEAAVILHRIQAVREYSDIPRILIEPLSGCPVIVGSDSDLVYLHEFVRVMARHVNTEKILASEPTLIAEQIEGGMDFLAAITEPYKSREERDADAAQEAPDAR